MPAEQRGQNQRQSARNLLAALGATMGCLSAGAAGATGPTYTVLHQFAGAADGRVPVGQLAVDAQGRLYGATRFGGLTSSGGVVFALKPPAAGGAWAETVLHAFAGASAGSRDGAFPAAGVLLGADGALYGTTTGGGAHGMGTLYRLLPPAAGQQSWRESVLHGFGGGSADGAAPEGGVLSGPGGVLYGTTSAGGANNAGAVFAFSPPPAGSAGGSERLLYCFTGGSGGILPSDGLARDPSGALYGVTFHGGDGSGSGGSGPLSGYGLAFKLSPPAVSGDPWTRATLHAFTGGSDGGLPGGNLLRDKAGALYGTAMIGGRFGYGTVFKLIPPTAPATQWREGILLSFDESGGAYPVEGLARAPDGSLIGATSAGGAGGGVLFQLKPPAAGGTGGWTETVLHRFSAAGATPAGPLVPDGKGGFYGMIAGPDAASPAGAVYRLVP